MLLLIASLTVLSPTGYAVADDCKSDRDEFWLCKGDPAWGDGYLLPSDRITELLDKEDLFEEVLQERDAFRGLVDKYQSQRDSYKELRDSLQDLLNLSISLQDDYKEQREKTEQELVIVEEKYLNEARRNAELEAELEANWSSWEVGLVAGSVGVGALLMGVGVTWLVMTLTP